MSGQEQKPNGVKDFINTTWPIATSLIGGAFLMWAALSKLETKMATVETGLDDVKTTMNRLADRVEKVQVEQATRTGNVHRIKDLAERVTSLERRVYRSASRRGGGEPER